MYRKVQVRQGQVASFHLDVYILKIQIFSIRFEVLEPNLSLTTDFKVRKQCGES